MRTDVYYWKCDNPLPMTQKRLYNDKYAQADITETVRAIAAEFLSAQPDALRRAGRSKLPVLLKRGMSATLEDFLMSAEYILSEGNYNVILCERGIRTFSQHSRFTLDLSVVPVIQRLAHLPILVDPSHGTGHRERVAPMARASLAAGADGVMVEVHPTPDRALSDGPQALIPSQFERLVTELRAMAPLLSRRMEVVS